MTKILLVEDDSSLGATLHERLIKEGYDVHWTTSRKEALAAGRERVFDLYIFDVGLPDGDGFELAREIGPKPLIFLTAQGDAESRLQGYDLGAEEYIPKPFHLRELLMRIRHVLENHRPMVELKTKTGLFNFDKLTFEKNGQSESVPVKDMQLLKLLIDRSPRVVSRDEALNALWGEDKFPSNRTVDNAILRLRTLLAEEAALIESVRGVGYRWNPNGEGSYE